MKKFVIIILFMSLFAGVLLLTDQRQPTQTINLALTELDTIQEISVTVSTDENSETVPLDTYIRGVLVKEMPLEFELEALKAQAIAIRTYLIYRLMNERDPTPLHIEIEGTTQKQAYTLTSDQSDEVREDPKIQQAIADTKEIIITYEGNPIDATYFAISAGNTLHSEQYWSQVIPYLRSVESPWDKFYEAKMNSEVVFSYAEMSKKLGVKLSPDVKISIVRDKSNQSVSDVRIANHRWTGREWREQLGLHSTVFTLTQTESDVVFRVRGKGHGVGMSQYGAQGMALAGYEATDIIKHYYKGVELTKLTDVYKIE